MSVAKSLLFLVLIAFRVYGGTHGWKLVRVNARGRQDANYFVTNHGLFAIFEEQSTISIL